MVFLKSDWGLIYWGEVKKITRNRVNCFYDDSTLNFESPNVFVVCPD